MQGSSSTRRLRMGQRGDVVSPLTRDSSASTPADGSTSGEGMLPHSSVNATSHYICSSAVSDPAFSSPDFPKHGPDQADASRTLTRATTQRSSGYEAGNLAPSAVCASDGASAQADRRTAPRVGRRSANRTAERECDCPKFYGIADRNLIRCIHIDNNRVALFHDKEWAGRLNLFVQTNRLNLLVQTNQRADATDPTSSVRYHGSSEADALDAFAAAEAELLGHEATR